MPKIENEAELRAAGFDAPAGLLVQATVRPGLKILIGATQDPSFGLMTMVGSSGQMVELLSIQDRTRSRGLQDLRRKSCFSEV